MDAIGVLLLLVGALAIGMIGQASQLLPRPGGWVIGTVAAAIGEFTGSELFSSTGDRGAEIGGLVVLPALVAGAMFAVVADLLTRILTPGPLGWRSEETPVDAPGWTGLGRRRRHRAGPAETGRSKGGSRRSPATVHRG